MNTKFLVVAISGLCILTSCKSKEAVLKDQFMEGIRRNEAANPEEYKLCNDGFSMDGVVSPSNTDAYEYAKALEAEGYARLSDWQSGWSNEKEYKVEILPKFQQDFEFEASRQGIFGGQQYKICFGNINPVSVDGYIQNSESEYKVTTLSEITNKPKWFSNEDIKRSILQDYNQLPEKFKVEFYMSKSDKGWDVTNMRLTGQ